MIYKPNQGGELDLKKWGLKLAQRYNSDSRICGNIIKWFRWIDNAINTVLLNLSKVTNIIYNYIKYLRTYDEELKVFRLYAPSITPESNAANFPLIVEDEEGNTMIRGISILLAQDLGVASDGSTGTYIDFRTV